MRAQGSPHHSPDARKKGAGEGEEGGEGTIIIRVAAAQCIFVASSFLRWKTDPLCVRASRTGRPMLLLIGWQCCLPASRDHVASNALSLVFSVFFLPFWGESVGSAAAVSSAAESDIATSLVYHVVRLGGTTRRQAEPLGLSVKRRCLLSDEMKLWRVEVSCAASAIAVSFSPLCRLLSFLPRGFARPRHSRQAGSRAFHRLIGVSVEDFVRSRSRSRRRGDTLKPFVLTAQFFRCSETLLETAVFLSLASGTGRGQDAHISATSSFPSSSPSNKPLVYKEQCQSVGASASEQSLTLSTRSEVGTFHTLSLSLLVRGRAVLPSHSATQWVDFFSDQTHESHTLRAETSLHLPFESEECEKRQFRHPYVRRGCEVAKKIGERLIGNSAADLCVAMTLLLLRAGREPNNMAGGSSIHNSRFGEPRPQLVGLSAPQGSEDDNDLLPSAPFFVVSAP